MRRLLVISVLGIAIPLVFADVVVAQQRISSAEDYVHVPMPPGFQVIATELDGPVFADSRGRTLYSWPADKQRNGNVGEPKNAPACYNTRITVNSGFMSPYPGGLILPDVDTRPTCTEMWPPALAGADARPIGAWTIVDRKDGTRQWAYGEHPLYTSSLDSAPGDVMGGTTRRRSGESPAVRDPMGPPPNTPPGFTVVSTVVGRSLVTSKNFSVYVNDVDTGAKLACDGACLEKWTPLLAPASAQAPKDWSFVDRAPGIRQWVFRGRPLYTYALDSGPRSVEGGDEPGWQNVYVQTAPLPPEIFTVQDTPSGRVLADARGMTVYIYKCGDDALDQLPCDHPDTTQAYRLAMCGAGDAARCLRDWPPILAAKGARSKSRSWSVIDIDPKTGHRAMPGQPDALHVWAYRDRPVYTYVGDRRPGDTEGDGRGEYRSDRQGFRAFWLRNDYFSFAQ